MPVETVDDVDKFISMPRGVGHTVRNACPFRAWIGVMRENHRIIENDVCTPARTNRSYELPLETKLARLEATIEQRNFTYVGVDREGKVYGAGQFNTTMRPGNGIAAWTLAVKSGRDRDASE